MQIVTILLLRHILPAIACSALSLCLVLLAFKVFRIKRPVTRHALLFIPLMKPLIILIGGFHMPGYEKIFDQVGVLPFRFGLQMPDPLNLISLPDASIYTLPNGAVIRPETTELFATVSIIAAVTMTFFLALHWIMLLRLRNRLAHSKGLDSVKHKNIIECMSVLCQRAKVKPPLLTLANIPCPVMIGALHPTIVLPEILIKEMSLDEIEAILAHEIAHIKRKDNIWLWLATIYRGPMSFNPITWYTFSLLSKERERAADNLAVRLTGKPVVLADCLVKVAERMLLIDYMKQLKPALKSSLSTKNGLEERISDLIDFKPYTGLALLNVRFLLLFILLFYVRYIFHIKVLNFGIFSFFG